VTSRTPRPRRATASCAAAALLATACGASQPPPSFQVVHLSGTPHERGLTHGRALRSRIRSFYTRLLTTSLLPYLNREQPDLSAFLPVYTQPRYRDGAFSRQLLLESGRELAKTLPQPYLDEMRGIAEGAGMEFDEILILNTFFDSLIALRGVVAFLRQAQSPRLASVEFTGAATDGRDNDGDGTTDEDGEGRLDPFAPDPTASLVEVPPDARVVLVLTDGDGIDPATLRVQLGDDLYTADAAALAVRPLAGEPPSLEVTLTPPAPLPAAAVLALSIDAGDTTLVEEPPPAHARFMRRERITFTTAGHGRARHEVPNEGPPDRTQQPTSIGFAVRGAASASGEPILAHHFALLDSGVLHDHAALFVHEPGDDGALAHVFPSWAGVVWGFSGMNEAGVAYLSNHSDTLSNPLVGRILDEIARVGHPFAAQLLQRGVPLGVMGREMLARARRVAEARDYLRDTPRTFGWNMMLADETGDLAAVELDSDLLADDVSTGFTAYGPADVDAHGLPWASVGADDLRVAAHYRAQDEDFAHTVSLGDGALTFELQPQRFWSAYYYRSVRAFSRLGARLAETTAGERGLDVEGVVGVLRTPDLVDTRDSMSAAVYEPRARRARFAMGTVPATDGEFVPFDLTTRALEGRR
jgi:hypothetical protein